MDYGLVSANAYLIEPPDLFKARLPPALRDRAPTLGASNDGGNAWSVDGLAPVPLSRIAPGGNDWDALSDPRLALKFSDLQLACSDPHERVKAQRLDSVDAEVLYGYPYLWAAISQLSDKALRLACVRAFNDWVSEFCAVDPTRLIGLGRIPTTGGADAVAELRRCVEQLGLRGAVLDAWPNGGAGPLPAEDDPFWAAAEELKVPISIDRGLNLSPVPPPDLVAPGRVPPAAGAVSALVFTGAYDRFPGLKIVVAHSNAGWVAQWLEGQDDGYLRTSGMTGRSVKRSDWLPADYIRHHCWFTFQHDRYAVINRSAVGTANLLWASQFPLEGSDWPENRSRAEQVTLELPAGDKLRLLATNTARLYRLPGYEAGIPEAEVGDYRNLLAV